MIVIVRLEVSDDTRRAFRIVEGRKGLATRQEIMEKVQLSFNALCEDFQYDADRDNERARARANETADEQEVPNA